MKVVDVNEAPRFRAMDGTWLSELLHPYRDSSLPLKCSIAYGELAVGQSNRRHQLKTSTEVFFILEGTGVLTCNAESIALATEQAFVVPPGAWQFLSNTGTVPLRFLCIVDPAWSAEDEIIDGSIE